MKTKGRIALSMFGVLWLIGFGVLWIVKPGRPRLVADPRAVVAGGGWATGVTLIVSGILAAAMIVYSYRHFREIKDDAAGGACTRLTTAPRSPTVKLHAYVAFFTVGAVLLLVGLVLLLAVPAPGILVLVIGVVHVLIGSVLRTRARRDHAVG